MLNDDERNQIETILLRERERTQLLLQQFFESEQDLRDRAGEIGLYRLHNADIGTEVMEKEKDFLLASTEGRRLYAVDGALQRLYRSPEEFGRCGECGGDIGLARLEVVPEAVLCAACQTRAEA